MREKVLGNEQLAFELSKETELNEGYNFHQIKHAAAMKRAAELLNPKAEFGINDELNCGKLNTKFLKEIRIKIKSIFE